MTKAAPGHLAEQRSARRHERRQHQGDLVADPSTRMLVEDRPAQHREIERLAAVDHGPGETQRLGRREAAQHDRHEQSARLISGNGAGDHAADEGSQPRFVELAPVALAGDDVVHDIERHDRLPARRVDDQGHDAGAQPPAGRGAHFGDGRHADDLAVAAQPRGLGRRLVVRAGHGDVAAGARTEAGVEGGGQPGGLGGARDGQHRRLADRWPLEVYELCHHHGLTGLERRIEAAGGVGQQQGGYPAVGQVAHGKLQLG